MGRPLATPGVYGREQPIECLAEERDAVFEQPIGHLGERNPERSSVRESRARVLDVLFETRPQPAVIAERLERRRRDRVDRVAADQLFNVAHVAIERILGARARPEKPLWMRALGGERLPLARAAQGEIALVGELRVGDRNLSEEVRQ